MSNWKKWIYLSSLIISIILLIPFSLPIVFALATAIMLEGAVKWFQKKLKINNRLYAVLLAFLIYLISLSAIVYFTVITIFQQVLTLSEKTPTIIKQLYETTFLPIMNDWQQYSVTLPKSILLSIEDSIENGIEFIDQIVQSAIQFTIEFVAMIPAFLIEFLIYLIALFLISLELPKLKRKLSKHLKDDTKEKLNFVVGQLSYAGVGFVKAQVLLSMLTYIMAYVGLWIMDVPYTAALALFIVFVDILPILGTGSALVPWAVISILQENESLGIGLILLFIIITVVRRVIEPKVLSSNMGISPLAAIISLYIGFKLVGFIGLFLGPVLVIVYEALVKANIIKWRIKI